MRRRNVLYELVLDIALILLAVFLPWALMGLAMWFFYFRY